MSSEPGAGQTGGRQGLRAAQQFPADFDGIVALNPVHDKVNLLTQMIWVHQATAKDPASYIPLAKYKMIQDAAIAACDASDGTIDGLIGDPAKCAFDPARLQCPSNIDAAKCLTTDQVAAVNKIYAPARNPRTGEEIFPGMPRGSEAGWPAMTGATSAGQRDPYVIPRNYYQNVVFNDPTWNPLTLDFDVDWLHATKVDASGAQMANNSADLSAFKARGGKLIQAAGWADQLVSPFSSINYFNRVAAQGSTAEAQRFHRLFMLPGVAHCSNTLAGGKGYGPDVFDGLDAISKWVETGTAPEQITASQFDEAGNLVRSRPLCPYPQIAFYRRTGSLNEAESFACR